MARVIAVAALAVAMFVFLGLIGYAVHHSSWAPNSASVTDVGTPLTRGEIRDTIKFGIGCLLVAGIFWSQANQEATQKLLLKVMAKRMP